MKLIGCITFSLVCALASVNADANTECLNSKCYVNKDVVLLQAVDHLNQAIELSFTIKDSNIRESIYNHLKPCLDCLKQEYFSKNYSKVTNAATTLYENLDEILADCQDRQLNEKIMSYINNMMGVIDNL